MFRFTLCLLAAATSVGAFTTSPNTLRTKTHLYDTTMTPLERDMDRAVQCAEKYELCSVEELNTLADGK